MMKKEVTQVLKPKLLCRTLLSKQLGYLFVAVANDSTRSGKVTEKKVTLILRRSFRLC